MRLSPDAFNNFLATSVRQNAVWRRAFACPCVSPSSGMADMNCPFCGSLGWQWAPGENVHTGMQALRPATAKAMFGVWDDGDAMLTIPSNVPLYEAGLYDRIMLSDATTRFSVNITPGVNERLRGKIVSIDRVCWITNGVLVQGDAPEVSDVGILTWPNGEPPEDATVSISGVKHVELFLAKDIPNSRNSGASGLPRKVAARRFDILGRAGTDPTQPIS